MQYKIQKIQEDTQEAHPLLPQHPASSSASTVQGPPMTEAKALLYLQTHTHRDPPHTPHFSLNTSQPALKYTSTLFLAVVTLLVPFGSLPPAADLSFAAMARYM